MTTTFDQTGQDSIYSFNVKTYENDQGISFAAGSYFYVEFARDISPRFNKLGVIRCYHEDQPTHCKYEGERRIAFLARTDLSKEQIFGHNFSIIGV